MADDVVVDSGRVDVRSACWRFVELLATDGGQRARHSCVCSGDGCPDDPRLSPLEAWRARRA